MKVLQLIFVAVLFCLPGLSVFCQCEESKVVWKKVVGIDTSGSLSEQKKLSELYSIEREAQKCESTNDTTYILALLTIGKYEKLLNNDHQKAVVYLNNALRLNDQLRSKGSVELGAKAYYYLAWLYDQQSFYKQALSYYDSTILFSKKITSPNLYEINARFAKTDIYLLTGDYQKAIDESDFGIFISRQKKDTLNFLYFLNRKAWGLYYENNLSQSFKHVQNVIPLAKGKDLYELGTAYKLVAKIYEKKKQFDSALYFYDQTIATSIATNYYPQIASDYNDLGNFYLDNLQQYKKAAACYHKTLFYASRIENLPDRTSKNVLAYTNLGETFMRQNKLDEAGKFFMQTFSSLNINLHGDIKNNPSSFQLNAVANKDLVFGLMDDKTKLHLQQFKNTNQRFFLTTCISTSALTDSVITQLRHEQFGEQSKLYWRHKTHNFFTTAMEACFLSNDPATAFNFMERSRAVLLTDQLNEIGAAAFLPQSELEKQKILQDRLIQLEQRFLTLSDTSQQYQQVQVQYLSAKADFEGYINSLELTYPVYYQYKYADKVPSLKDLQQYLSKNDQSFVHYFMGDTATYILAITPTKTKFIRLSKKEFNKEDLLRFLKLCSDKQALNNNYDHFTQLSNSIYKAIFQPLQLPGGRIVICADNVVIPFDALCTDAKGKQFLLSDYSFSYVYSARFLMKQFRHATARGNFLGFAPVSFASYLKVPALKNAARSLQASAAYYKNDKLFTEANASRKNFLDYASSYSIVNIFSHARADTTDNEPVLFMQDSLIHLSDLQLLDHPATKLVLLSACQTNVGKAAAGEGIYSLARGFATAGIPSVAATLWEADEQTIYAVSEKFNEYLSGGMSKDKALQKAKLYFIENNSSEKMLPYYWANMILIGNTEAINLTTNSNHWWWIALAGFAAITAIVFLTKQYQAAIKRRKLKFQAKP